MIKPAPPTKPSPSPGRAVREPPLREPAPMGDHPERAVPELWGDPGEGASYVTIVAARPSAAGEPVASPVGDAFMRPVPRRRIRRVEAFPRAFEEESTAPESGA